MAGDDVLHGGTGDDTIDGGPDRNQLFGDAGADVFSFGYGASSRFPGLVGLGQDVVMDFEQGRDRLDVSALYRFQNQDADRIFLGQTPFSGSGQPELRYRHEDGWTVVELDTPPFPAGPGSGGDGKVDFTIRLAGEVVLTAGDFVF
jgi:Ca2+-binding RTX toxin-like protein